MTSRVLVADDSLTIQKVIGITLANSGYELVECVNEEELFRKIQSNHFDLILLDFNLSDSRSGYELSKQISNAVPGAAIIVMLGTFDSIDEGQFSSCGIADKIIKPFESSKFVKKCRDLLEGGRTITPSTERPASSLENNAPSDDLDLWKVDAPVVNSKKEDETPLYGASSETKNLDPLTSEIEGWGFNSNNYLEDKFQKTFPPVIEENSEPSVIEKFESSSTFINKAPSLAAEDEDATDPSFVVPENLNRNLLTEIDSEVSAEAFWAVDEIVPVKADEYNDIVDTNLEEVTADLTETIKFFHETEARATKVEAEKPQPQVVQETKAPQETKKEVKKVDEEADTIIHMDQDELVEKLKISLRPMIEEMVREFCRQNAEKVAWEVIPDLAENLIRKEIKEISDSVQH